VIDEADGFLNLRQSTFVVPPWARKIHDNISELFTLIHNFPERFLDILVGKTCGHTSTKHFGLVQRICFGILLSAESLISVCLAKT
jgi:hypothetical protein